jgi:Fe-S-cluster-containing hydrogenase component 2
MFEASDCYAMRMCPTEAISNYFLINKELCINCGTCTHQCSMGVFNARLGSIELAHTKIDYGHICGETNEQIYSDSVLLASQVLYMRTNISIKVWNLT